MPKGIEGTYTVKPVSALGGFPSFRGDDRGDRDGRGADLTLSKSDGISKLADHLNTLLKT
jgi:hypothetical protein